MSPETLQVVLELGVTFAFIFYLQKQNQELMKRQALDLSNAITERDHVERSLLDLKNQLNRIETILLEHKHTASAISFLPSHPPGEGRGAGDER